MAVLANDTAVKPRRRLHRARGAKHSAATRVSPCAVRKPGQAGWRDRQARAGAITFQTKATEPVCSASHRRQGPGLTGGTTLDDLNALRPARLGKLLRREADQICLLVQTLR